MKYFTDSLNDLNGYLAQLEQLKTRIHNEAHTFFTSDDFHDSHIFSLNVKNKFNHNSEEDENDPTLIEAHLLHASGDEYLVRWTGVNKFLMDYDIQRNTYHDSEEIAFDGQRGLDDWMVDELTAYDHEYLCHEIVLASDTTIIIRFRNIEVVKL